MWYDIGPAVPTRIETQDAWARRSRRLCVKRTLGPPLPTLRSEDFS
jgi:hypothetical protein